MCPVVRGASVPQESRDNLGCRSLVACAGSYLLNCARPAPRHPALLGNSPPGAGELVLARGGTGRALYSCDTPLGSVLFVRVVGLSRC